MTCTLDGLPDILWHGTTLHNARLIAATRMLRTGRFERPSKVQVCLTPDRATATFFAMMAAERHPRGDDQGRPVLLAIPRAALDPKRLRADPYLLCAPFGPVARPAHFTLEDFQAQLRRDRGKSTRNWRHSLHTVHGIVHGGPIALDTIRCDMSVIDVPFWGTRDEMHHLEHTATFPKGWTVPEPQWQAITPAKWDPRLQTAAYIPYGRTAQDVACDSIHAALGHALELIPHAITRDYRTCQLHYQAGDKMHMSDLHAAFHLATTGPGSPLLMLPAQRRVPGGRAIVPTLKGITLPKKAKKPYLTFHLHTDLVWLHPSRLPQHSGQTTAACTERAAA